MTSSNSEASTPQSSPAASPSADVILSELLERRQRLLTEISTLEQRRNRLQDEIHRHFAGTCDELSRRVQGFQEYLVGALQELSDRAQDLELTPQKVMVQPSPLDQPAASPSQDISAASPFLADQPLIEDMIRGFQDTPDFYGPPWRLRRHLEASHGELLRQLVVSAAGTGRTEQPGAVVAATCCLVRQPLPSSRSFTDKTNCKPLSWPARRRRLGQWRRGLQDSLGLTREDFGPGANGISLFERPDALIEAGRSAGKPGWPTLDSG